MSFGDPTVLWLLLVIPPAMVLFFWWSWRKRQQLMRQFIQSRLLPGLIAGVSSARQKARAAGLVLAVFCLILALTRPRWGYELEEVTQRGLDIMVAVDTSKSMLAQDIEPNRLARAKLAVLDLMQQAKSDRLGLIAFAGTAFLQCPLTVDDTAFRESLEALNVHTIPEGGTALAEAIETARRAFKEGDNYKVLVLFTDGEDQDSGALEAAREAAKAGLRIFTIGIGTPEGELLRIQNADGKTDYVRDENGNAVKSHLNAKLLEEIAQATPGGFYLPLRGANTIDVLYQRGLAPLPKTQSKERWLRRARERYQWPLALGIVLLAAELLLPDRKRTMRHAPSGQPDAGTGHGGRRRSRTVAAVAAVLAGAMVPWPAHGSASSALREYQSGKYQEALKQYEEAIQKRGDDLRLHFNAGTAAYRDRQFDQAARYFDKALNSPDLNLQEPAYYNLGNTLFHLGQQNPDPQKRIASWEDAVKQYESALKLNTNDADARFNQEYVKKLLEELKKQQQQQQQQQQQNQSQSKQNSQDKNQSSQNQQQNQQSKNDQSQKPQSQQNQEQKPAQSSSSQNQQSSQSAQNQEQQQQQQSEQQKQGAQSNEAKAGGQEKQNAESKPSEQQAQAYPAGQMSPQEARQLLDSQRNDELMLPASRKGEPTDQHRVIRDW
jgi:Ca-activated chloride channel family protein